MLLAGWSQKIVSFLTRTPSAMRDVFFLLVQLPTFSFFSFQIIVFFFFFFFFFFNFFFFFFFFFFFQLREVSECNVDA